MTFPSSDVSRVNFDNTGDNPQLARADIDDMAVKFNLLRNHFSVFMQGLIDDTDAATARATLGALAASAASAYGLTLLDDADAATARATLGLVIGSNVPSPTGTGASGTWGISISGSAANSFGTGQTWQNMTASRALSTNYTNSTGLAIVVSVTMNVIAGQTVLYVDGLPVVRSAPPGASPGSSIQAVVPAGSYYSVAPTASNTINIWHELR